MNSTTRTFRARYNVEMDRTIIGAHDHLITVTGYGDSIGFKLDGQAVSYERAEGIRQLALNLGTFKRLSGPSLTPSIGNRVAHQLHIDLARLGHVNHDLVASEALERPVTSLAALTQLEAQAVWSLACALREIPTQPSIVYAVAL